MIEAPVRGQAARIIEKFGGPPRLAELLKTHRSNICRWTYPPSRGGTGGYVPTKRVPQIMEMAEMLGIEITHEDWTA